MSPNNISEEASSPNPERGRRTPPKNNQFDQLRTRWQGNFEAILPPLPPTNDTQSTPAADEPCMLETVNFTQLSPDQRKRILDLLDRRAHLEELASTQAQRTAFSEWLIKEAQQRPGQTVSGRIGDPQVLPSSVPVSVVRSTPLYEFDTPRGKALRPGDSIQLVIQENTHLALVHSIRENRVTFALADLTVSSISGAVIAQENPIKLGEGTQVTNRFRYKLEMLGPITFAPGTIVDFQSGSSRIRGQVVDGRGKTVAVETHQEIAQPSVPGTLLEVRYWEDYYCRIRQLQYTTFGGKFSHTTIAELWDAYPDSKTAKFMRAVCRPKDYAFPQLNAHGKLPAFFNRSFFDECSLLPYIVSPELLPSKLLSDIKLIVWPQQRLNAQRVLEMKADPAVIEGFKMIFEAARWLRLGQRRMLVIKPPVEQTRQKYRQARDMDPSIIGSILYLREKVPGGLPQGRKTEFEPAPITIQFFPTAYEAYRRNPHANHRYDEELAQQVEFRIKAQDINQRISLYWSDGETIKKSLTEELTGFVAHWSGKFEHSEHRLKKELLTFLNGIIERLPNMGQRLAPIQAKLVASGNRALRRNEELPNITRTMTTDQQLLKQLIRHAEEQIALMHTSVGKAVTLFEDCGSQLFSPDTTARGRHDAALSFMATARLNLAGLNDIRCRPFTVFADKIRSLGRAFHEALTESTEDSARDYLAKLSVVTKLAHTNSVFEELKFRVSFDTHVTFANLEKCLVDLRFLIASPKTVHTRIGKSYQRAYDRTNRELVELDDNVTQFLSGDLAPEARPIQLQAIRTLLNAINIEERIRDLP